ncbi:MAG: ATP-binding protein [Thermacetogeniaceae bacterium]
MHPCPCGFWGDMKRGCTCTPHQAQRYRNRISGPILDRIDLHIEVPRIELEELVQEKQGEPSAEIRKRVMEARELQMARFKNERINKNSDMDSNQIKKYCRLNKESRSLLYNIFQKLNLSMRSFDRLLKVARTIADLEASEEIKAEHVAEAVQYRLLDRPLTIEV